MIVMGEAIVRNSKKLLIIYYFLTIHIIAAYFLIDRIASMYELTPTTEVTKQTSPVEQYSPTPQQTETLAPPTPAQTQVVQVPAASGLIIPVAGVSREQLSDSFADTRSDERVHDAIDIPAPAGTPVVAADDGKIIKFFDSEAGGITIYQLSADQKYVFYYAHLQSRAGDINVGDDVKQGRTIAFVGDTGNAGAGNYHLHFSIMSVPDPKRYWEGVYINPFPLLTQ